MDRSSVVGVARSVVGFAAFFAGSALQAVGRSMSEDVAAFAGELEGDVIDEVVDEGAVAMPATLSDAARRMILEGTRPSVERLEEPPAPLAGSVRARFARGA